MCQETHILHQYFLQKVIIFLQGNLHFGIIEFWGMARNRLDSCDGVFYVDVALLQEFRDFHVTILCISIVVDIGLNTSH